MGRGNMPKATVKYQFEWKVWEWAEALTKSLTGAAHSFMMVLQDDGIVRQLIVGMEPGRMDSGLKENMTEEYHCWILFEPFDGPT